MGGKVKSNPLIFYQMHIFSRASASFDYTKNYWHCFFSSTYFI